MILAAILKTVATRVLKGGLKVADKGILLGAIHNYKEKNGTEPGKIDWDKLVRTAIGSTIPVILLIALLKGWINIDELKGLLKMF